MKRIGFFSAISLMILCICILGAGVYAANITDRNMGATGTIQIPANLIGVEIEGYLGNVVLDGSTVKNEKGEAVSPKFETSHTDNPPKSWEFDDEDEVKHLTFNTEEANSIDDVKESITISLVITNTSDLNLSIYFKDGANQNAVVVDSLNGTAKNGDTIINQSIVNAYLGSGSLARGSDANPTKTIVKVNFALNKLIDISDAFKFDYNLVVEEAELIESPYNDVIAKISELEQLSVDYNTANSLSVDTQLRVMQYIRATAYSGSAWDAVAGTVEEGFTTYVTANQGNSNASSLQDLQFIRIPALVQDIDFRHMIATLNVCVKNQNLPLPSLKVMAQDLAGWGGDLCQLAINVKDAIGDSTDLEFIKSKARELFMSSAYAFGSADLFGDIDAINIYTIYSAQETKSLSTAITTYYSGDLSTRKTRFATTTGLNGLTAEQIIDRLSSNPSITIWCGESIGFNEERDVAIFNAVATVFANYLAN